MSKPTALGLYLLHQRVKEMHAALRADARERGEWGAVQALESAQYYLFGAAGWLVQDLSPDERAELELELEAALGDR